MTTATIDKIAVYWDKHDPAGEGWAFTVRFVDGREEGGPSDWPEAPIADGTALQEAVVNVAYQYGAAIVNDDVVAEPKIDGGYAEWIKGRLSR